MKTEYRYNVILRATDDPNGLNWHVDDVLVGTIAAFYDKNLADEFADERNTAESEAAWERRISG